jgi:murein DD-endopeptidase MepM/ murein hydrolase activator NlpD
MAAGNGGGGRSGNPAAPGKCGRSRGGARALRALLGLMLVLCASCTSRPDEATVVAIRHDVPLMTDSLLLKPVDRGRLTSGYGIRYNPISKRRQKHLGIDWAAPRGTAVRAAGDGVVAAVERRRGYGHYLRIDHGGTIETAYAHLERYASGIRPGQVVHQGDLIAKVGSSGRATGPHLHYEVLVAGLQVDPLAFAAPQLAQAPEPAELEGELAIGGPDLAADELADQPAPSDSEPVAAAPPERIGASSIVWVKDLLGRPPP